MAAVLDAVAEDINGAALGDFALEAGEESAAGGTILLKTKGRSGIWLCVVQKSA